jgi:hypothetical protein
METSLAFPQRPNDADKTKPATPARPSLLPKHPRQTDPYPFPTGFSHPSSLYPINVRWNLKTPISSSFPTTTLRDLRLESQNPDLFIFPDNNLRLESQNPNLFIFAQ